MPWVSEWKKDSSGNWVNVNYYVPPASGQAGGEDYKNKITVHTLTDANTGATVKQAQNSATVSYEEGKVIEQALSKQEELVKQGMVNVQIEQAKNDKNEVVGLQVAADYPKKTVGRGQWTQMSDTERESYLKSNPNLYVLTPEGEVPAVISEGESSYFNPKGFIPQETNSTGNMVTEAEYNKLKEIEDKNKQLAEKETGSISKYDPGYSYERPLTEDSLSKRSQAESALKSTISEKYQAKSLMEQYAVLGDERFYIDVGEGSDKKRLLGKDAFNWLSNYSNELVNQEFEAVKAYQSKGTMQGNFLQRITDSATEEFNKQLARWSGKQSTDEEGKYVVKPNTLSYVMAGGAYVAEAIASTGGEAFKEIAKVSFTAGVQAKGALEGWSVDKSSQVANKLMSGVEFKQNLNMAESTGRVAFSVAPYFMTGGVGTAKAVVDVLSSKSSEQIVQNVGSGLVFGAIMKGGKVAGEYAAMVMRGTSVSVAGKAIKAGLWTAEHALPLYMAGATAYGGYNIAQISKDNPELAKELTREMSRQFGGMTIGSQVGGYVTHKALSSVRLATLKGNVKKDLIEAGATKEQLVLADKILDATYGKQSKLLKEAKPVDVDFSKPEALQGDKRAQKVVSEWYQKHKGLVGIYGSTSQQSYEGVPKRVVGDIDTSVMIPQSQSFFAKSLSNALKKAGYSVDVWASPRDTHPGTWEVSIMKGGQSVHLASFSNPGQSGLYGSMHEMLGGFEFPRFQWESTPSGLKVLNLRTQARLKLSGAYGILGSVRPKDMTDLIAITNAVQKWSLNYNSPGLKVPASSAYPVSYSITTSMPSYAYSAPKQSYSVPKYETPKYEVPKVKAPAYPKVVERYPVSANYPVSAPVAYPVSNDYPKPYSVRYAKPGEKYPKQSDYPKYPEPKYPVQPKSYPTKYDKPTTYPKPASYPKRPEYPKYPKEPKYPKQPGYPGYPYNPQPPKPPITPQGMPKLSFEAQSKRSFEEAVKAQQRLQSSLSARVFNIRGEMPKGAVNPLQQRPLPVREADSKISRAIKKIMGL